MQSRMLSLVESLLNVVAGYTLGVLTQIVIFPILNVDLSLGENMVVAAVFSTVSLIRGYALRRLFNKVSIWLLENRSRMLQR